MANTWILVAQGSFGRLLEVRKNGGIIHLIKEFYHPKTADKGTDIYTDRPGRTFESAFPIRHAKALTEDPTDHERKLFAKEIAAFLSKNHADNQFKSIILVAAPELLGELRKSLPGPVSHAVAHELNKDLLSQGLTDNQLVEKIRDDLDLAII